MTNQSGDQPTPEYDPPIVLNFSDADAMKASAVSFATISFPNEEKPSGDYAFATANGTNALSLRYNLFQNNTSFPAYRFTMKLTQLNAMKDDSYYVIRVTYMTTDTINGRIMLVNPSYGYQKVIVSNTAASVGQFVTSSPVSLSGSDVLELIAGHQPVVLGYTSELLNSEIYIKEILLFNSMNAANAYGEAASSADGAFALSFGFAGNTRMKYESGSKNGVYEIAKSSDVVSIGFCANPIVGNFGNYCIMPYLTTGSGLTEDYKYVRVSYRAKNPSGIKATTVSIVNPANGTDFVRSPMEISDTGESYALSSTLRMRSTLISRIASGEHFCLSFGAETSGGSYEINGIYFFREKAEADAFAVTERGYSSVTIGGHALSDYKIIIPENAVKREAEAAELLQNYFGMVSGVELPIAVDTETAVGTYEILVGYTNRSESVSAYASYLSGATPKSDYSVQSVGNKLVFATYYNFTLDQIVPMFAQAYLKVSIYERPANINLVNCNLEGRVRLTPYTWADSGNVSNPVVFTDDFATESNGADAQNWCEEGSANQWSVQDGKYVSAGNGYELTYLHVYEKNASLQAELTPTAPSSGKGTFGLQLRYTSEYGYVRGGYDYAAGCWYIEYREGEDFSAFRVGTASAALTNGTTYTVKLQVVNGTATLYVNDVQKVSGTVGHLSPGRIAIYDTDVTVKADNVRVEFLSGSEGHILTGITHTILPDEAYREGGTVIELNDGNLHYIHHSGAAFVSEDDGKTWEKENSWYSGAYPSVIRLKNGNLLKSVYENGYSCMYTSMDDGKTWTFTGNVCKTPHEVAVSNSGEHTLRAGNMNDKLTQISSGRIFFVQNYESSTYVTIGTNNHVVVCFEIFYSDDNGTTWTKSQTASYNMSGIENAYRIGEGKVIECAGGVLRCMSSWNEYDSIFYSESTDNGVTWGPVHMMTDFKCTTSSMAIVRDPYGPTDYTYYMVWCYDSRVEGVNSGMPRSRLALAYTTDGKNWQYLGDVWCWESGYYSTALLNHIVDPFIYVTEDAVIIGSGIAEKAATAGEDNIAFNFHQAQRQNIWRIEKSSLSAYQSWPSVQY